METNLIPPPIKAAGMPRKRCNRESCREHPKLQQEGCSLPITPPQDYPSWWCYAATPATAASATLSCTGLSRHSGRNVCPPSLEAQLTTNTESVSLGSYCNDMFKVVTTICQQIMTELNGAESEEDWITAITREQQEQLESNHHKKWFTGKEG
jgi:hypothetical protein